MGVYTRFKKNPDGLKQLVELIESAPLSRRQKMIDVGMEEDPDYTRKALQYVMVFEDILQLSDQELVEVLAETPARFIAYAIFPCSEEVKARFLKLTQSKVLADFKEALAEPKVSESMISGSQMKVIEATRKLVRKNKVKLKKIPS